MILKISDYKNFIFDCDGVILDSNLIKTKSFEQALKNEKTEHRNRFIEYHLSNTGISRYEKFDYFFKNIKSTNIYEAELEELLLNFSKIVKNNLMTCNLTSNIDIFIKKLNKLNKRLFVISASDEKELIEIFKKRRLNDYFNKILGSPLNKIDNIKKLNISEEYNKTIFFGDSLSDYKAAVLFNLDFVYVKKYSLWNVPGELKKSPKFREIEDFSYLEIVS